MKLTFTNAREKSRAEIAPTFESCIIPNADDIYNNAHAHKILQLMDNYAAVILADTNAPSLNFRMNEKDAMKLIHEANMLFHEDDIAFYGARYDAVSSNNTAYFLYIAVDCHDFDQMEPQANGILCRKKSDGSIECYDRKKRIWSSDQKKQKIYNLGEGNNAELDFTDMLEYYTGLPLMLIKPGIAMQKIQGSEDLIAFSERLQGLGKFQMLIVSSYGADYEEDEAFPVLRSSDMNRMGSAVYFKDGKYRICQMADVKQNTDPMILFDRTKAETKESFFNEIDSTENQDEVYALLTDMWDKSCRGKKWFTIPISKRAYINYEYKEKPDYAVHFVSGEEVLTESENRALRKFKSAMAKAA